MQSKGTRAAVLIGLVVVAVALFFVLKDDDSDDSGGSTVTAAAPATTTQPPSSGAEIPEIVIENGKVAGTAAEIDVQKGETVDFVVISDTAGDVHVHGYDIEKPVEPGQEVNVSFPADLEGGYEVEFHLPDSEIQIAEIKVSP